jgi:Sulphur transport
MTVGLFTAGFAVSLVCALVMGYAIHRGATCTVAAVSQLVEQGKWGRFLGLMEAALWVAGGLIVARAFGLLPDLPLGFAVNERTIIGGILLGAGAYINKSCVFGTIAKIGARDWAYLATPAGFLAGASAISLFYGQKPSGPPMLLSPVNAVPAIALVAFLIFAAWRIGRITMSKSGSLAERVWAPHEATVVIGIAFVIMFVAAGAWAYTDLLAELAFGMPGDFVVRVLLLTSLLAGSMLSGGSDSRATPTPFHASDYIRTSTGGAAMGAGSVLIPGSNDGLILVGMPLLHPYAWIGIGTMCITIFVAIFADRLIAKLSARRRAAD